MCNVYRADGLGTHPTNYILISLLCSNSLITCNICDHRGIYKKHGPRHPHFEPQLFRKDRQLGRRRRLENWAPHDHPQMARAFSCVTLLPHYIGYVYVLYVNDLNRHLLSSVFSSRSLTRSIHRLCFLAQCRRVSGGSLVVTDEFCWPRPPAGI